MEENEIVEPNNNHKGSRIAGYILFIACLLAYVLGSILIGNSFQAIKTSATGGEVLGNFFLLLISCVFGGLLYIISIVLGIINTTIMIIFKKYKWEVIFPIINIAAPIITVLIFIFTL